MPKLPQGVAAASASRPPIIETPRLVLREMTNDDLDFLAEMVGDPDVMRFYPQVYDREGAKAWLDRALMRYATDGHGFWLVVDRATGEPRGQVGVLKQDVEGRSEIEVGYMIHRLYWRQGLAFEAAAACHQYVFNVMNRSRVIALVRPVNLPSQAVARKLGMSIERRAMFRDFEHDIFVRNRPSERTG